MASMALCDWPCLSLWPLLCHLSLIDSAAATLVSLLFLRHRQLAPESKPSTHTELSFWDAFHPDACKGCFLSSFRSLFTFHLIKGGRWESFLLPAQLLWYGKMWTETWRRRERKLGRYLFSLSSQRNLNPDWVFENRLFIFFYVCSSVLEKESRFLLSVMVKQ